jgi:hypothetical protein
MSNYQVVGLVVLVLFFIVIGPLLTIGSINILFGTEIPLTIHSWAAAAFLMLVVGSGGHK